jgi:hypothetical protein
MSKIDFRIERVLNFEIGGEHKVGTLIIGGIEEVRQGTWACYFVLPFVVSDSPKKIYGIDPIRALEFCLSAIKELLAGAEQDGFATVWLFKRGDLGGFRMATEDRN